MKKTLLLIAATCTLAACNKPADNNTDAPARRIVSIEETNQYSETPNTYNLTYNKQGQLTGFNSESDLRSAKLTFTYEGNKVIVNYDVKSSFVGPDDQTETYQSKGTLEATLNAQKYAETIKHIEPDPSTPGREMTSTIAYNANGEVITSTDKLVQPPYDDDVDVDKAQWSEGNMTKWLSLDESTMSYDAEKNNLTNIDLNWLLYSGEDMNFAFSSNSVLQILPMMGYCGKRSENYVIRQSIYYSPSSSPETYVFDYTFDADKYPTEIKIYRSTTADPKALYRTYEFKYNK